jgi:hypothetical protein
MTLDASKATLVSSESCWMKIPNRIHDLFFNDGAGAPVYLAAEV